MWISIHSGITVKELIKDKNRAVVETLIKNADGLVPSGEAPFLNVDKIKIDAFPAS